jgi:hypothetical protein
MKLAAGLFLILAAPLAAQDSAPPFKTPALPAFVRQPSEFVPEGWKLIAVKSGDLNGDKQPDAAVLMRMTDPGNIKPVDTKIFSYSHDDTNPYLLAIGFARIDGYELAVTNHSLFPDYTAPMHEDTPPDGNTIGISRGVLTLSFEHLRSTEQFRFRWNGNAFALIGYDCGGVSGAGGEVFGLSANYLTRKARVERGTIDSDKSDFWTVRIRPGKRPTLDLNEWEFGWIGQDIDGNVLSC